MADPRGTRRRPRAAQHAIGHGQARRAAAAARAAAAVAPAGPRLYGGTELTPEGEQEAAAFKREDNPRFSCQTTSIIFDWTFDGPVNRITQNKDTIVIQYGQMGLKRTIYMNMKPHPANVKPTPCGPLNRALGGRHAGRRHGRLPARRAERAGPPQRQAARRRALHARSEDDEADAGIHGRGSGLPEGQVHGSDVIGVADAPYAKDNCKEQGFIDYSKQVHPLISRR